jgi:hypothetical protein
MCIAVRSKPLANSMAPEPEGSSPRSQDPATGHYPEPTESTPHARSQSPQEEANHDKDNYIWP